VQHALKRSTRGLFSQLVDKFYGIYIDVTEVFAGLMHCKFQRYKQAIVVPSLYLVLIMMTNVGLSI